METIIRIKKNKPAFKALIILAKELEKNDQTSISVTEAKQEKENLALIIPKGETSDPFLFFEQLADYPSSDEIRKRAWPNI